MFCRYPLLYNQIYCCEKICHVIKSLLLPLFQAVKSKVLLLKLVFPIVVYHRMLTLTTKVFMMSGFGQSRSWLCFPLVFFKYLFSKTGGI